MLEDGSRLAIALPEMAADAATSGDHGDVHKLAMSASESLDRTVLPALRQRIALYPTRSRAQGGDVVIVHHQLL